MEEGSWKGGFSKPRFPLGQNGDGVAITLEVEKSRGSAAETSVHSTTSGLDTNYLSSATMISPLDVSSDFTFLTDKTTQGKKMEHLRTGGLKGWRSSGSKSRWYQTPYYGAATEGGAEGQGERLVENKVIEGYRKASFTCNGASEHPGASTESVSVGV
ncbi:hypothetical protein EDB89DRAFT_1911520 [Lactarius sanguifluus]|nr:hypothetical protein EDB89DRAFT_1911520 [Lactarius sanguifluus]